VSTDTYSPSPAPRRGLAIASLVLGILSIPTFGCLIVGAVAGIVLGIVALMRANREPQVYGGKGMAIAGIATSALSFVILIPLGIIAAIAIPSLLRARISANEHATISDIRTVISAEMAYQSASGGSYGSPQCLAAPTSCLPAYSGPTFIDPDLASATVKNGYRRTFHAGGPTGSESFAYTAVPAEPGRTGVRGFCGDSTGRVCFTQGGSAPALVGGLCDPSCQEL
jgi:type IV pilus assembly protein PilA